MTATMESPATAARGFARDDIAQRLGAENARFYRQVPDPVEYVPHPSFADADAEDLYAGPDSRVEVPAWIELGDDEQALCKAARAGALSRADEAHLFLSYNYARYRLALLAGAQRRRPSLRRAREMARWQRLAEELRSDLVRANLALVLAMVKRARPATVEFAEAVSEGNLALLRAVEKFDVSRGFKFSTYGCRAILKSFGRLAARAGRYRRHFPVEFDPDMERSDQDVHRHEMQREASLDALREVLVGNRAGLTEVERRVVHERFAICSEGPKRTLSEVGRRVGLTNERVRQIQNHALGKLRIAFAELHEAS